LFSLSRNATSSNVNSQKGAASPLVYTSINFPTPAGGIDYSILEIPSSKKDILYRETDSQKQ